MIRRLLELCLVAYPRARRERDRDFLRDLALDLGGTNGFARQAASLLVGGLKERIESYRRLGAAPMRTCARRFAIGCLALIVVTVGASTLIVTRSGDAGSVHEVEEYACAYAQGAPSGRHSTTWKCTRRSTAVAWLSL
jgi:hypothetical protein